MSTGNETNINLRVSSRSRVWAAILCCVAVASVAIAVRVRTLGDLNYWFDESFSLRMSQFSVSEILSRSAEDTHPPAFFIGLKGWTSLFGIGHIGARSLSVVWSVAAVIAAFLFVLEALNADETAQKDSMKPVFGASVAGLCLALSPLQVTWAQQVRMYSSNACLAIVTTWLLWRSFENPEKKSRWISYAFLELLAIYTHVTMLFVFAAHAIAGTVILLQRRRSNALSRGLLTRFSWTMMALVSLSLPWIVTVKSQHARVHDDFWIMPFTADMLWESMVKCFGVYQRPAEDPNVGLWISQAFIVVVVFVAVGRKTVDLLSTAAAIVPFLALIVLSIIDVNIVNARYFIAGHAMSAVVVGLAIAKLPFWILRVGIAAYLTSFLWHQYEDYHAWRTESPRDSGIPALLEAWKEHRAESEPLVICNPMFYTTARVYADEGAPLFIYGRKTEYPFFVGTAIVDDPEFLDQEQISTGKLQTVWTCDFGHKERFISPVVLNDQWHLVSEVSTRDYSGMYFLRRYDRR